ncbi:MAG: hypothetical protein U0232_02120 [Thermomicrobiales bacterium]
MPTSARIAPPDDRLGTERQQQQMDMFQKRPRSSAASSASSTTTPAATAPRARGGAATPMPRSTQARSWRASATTRRPAVGRSRHRVLRNCGRG